MPYGGMIGENINEQVDYTHHQPSGERGNDHFLRWLHEEQEPEVNNDNKRYDMNGVQLQVHRDYPFSSMCSYCKFNKPSYLGGKGLGTPRTPPRGCCPLEPRLRFVKLTPMGDTPYL